MRLSKITPYILVLPLLALSLLFICGMLNGLLQSFGIIPSLGLTRFTFDYYRELLSRPDILASIGISLYIATVSSVSAVVLGVVISACAVITGWTRKNTFQIFKIPIIVPHIVVALLVINVFSQSGMLSRLLYNLGLLKGQEQFFSILYSPSGIGIILAYLWKEIPFVTFFVVTIMANINSSLGEAAVNLGATKFKAFFSVTLPLCMPTIKNSFLLIFAYSFGAYELPFLLGATAPKALPVQAFIEYMHPDLLHRPYAMALNSIMFVFSLMLAWLFFRTMQRDIRVLTGDNK